MSERTDVVAEVQRFLRLLWRDGEVRELRVPKWDGYKTASGYFDDPAKMALAAASFDGTANVYVTLNPVVPALHARYHDRVERKAGATTSDADVLVRRYLYVDLDPRRPAEVSATDEEVEAARRTARAIVADLQARGWPVPITSMSGNGIQLLWSLDLPNDPASDALVAGVLRHLAESFDDPDVKIDTSVANAARIAAVIGTLKMKGDSTPERPHRRSTLLYAPERLDPVPAELLRVLVASSSQGRGPRAEAPNDAERMPRGWVRERLDAKGISYRELPPDKVGTLWYGLERCPAHPDDGTPWQCGVGEMLDGKALGKCFHDRGAEWRWKDFKTALGLEPDPAFHFRSGATGAAEDAGPDPTPSDDDGEGTGSDGPVPGPEPADRWPEPPDPGAYHGLVGELVDAVAGGTEADPVALLGSLLAIFGVLVDGPWAYQGSMQTTNLFVVLAGDTASGRKGTAHSIARAIFGAASPGWESVLAPGLGSGEGLIGHLQRNEHDPRALVIESELGRLLSVMARDGSVLSPILRDAWDGVPMGRILSRESAVVVRHHVGVLGHITPTELRAKLTHIDAANGFGNRFLWLAVRRPRLVPFPQDPLADGTLTPLLTALGAAVDVGRGLCQFAFSEAAKERWEELYLRLALQPRWGLAGAMTARAEAQITRLALLHAALDRARHIEPGHLEAAIALWAYAERSVRHLFGESTGDRWADVILAELRENGDATMAQLKMTHGFHDPARLAAAVELLVDLGLVARTRGPSTAKGGRRSPLLTLLERRAA